MLHSRSHLSSLRFIPGRIRQAPILRSFDFVSPVTHFRPHLSRSRVSLMGAAPALTRTHAADAIPLRLPPSTKIVGARTGGTFLHKREQ